MATDITWDELLTEMHAEFWDYKAHRMGIAYMRVLMRRRPVLHEAIRRAGLSVEECEDLDDPRFKEFFTTIKPFFKEE